MQASEEEFLKRLRATFKVEAEEHLHAISSGLLQLETDASAPLKIQTEHIDTVIRHAHSLKGAARAVNLADVEAICQSLESFFSAWKRLESTPGPAHFDALHRALNLMSKSIPTAEGVPSAVDKAQFQTVARELNALCAAPEKRSFTSRRSAPVENLQPSISREPAPSTTPAPADISLQRPIAGPTVRVAVAKLDRLILEAEELLALKLAGARQVTELSELLFMLRQWHAAWAKLQPHLGSLPSPTLMPDAFGQANAAPPAVREFMEWSARHLKAAEGKLRALSKFASQEQAIAARRIDDLLAGSKELVMLPFSVLFDLFPKLVRDLSREQGKEAALVLRGANVQADKRILDEMKDPLIHLVRNCIDHGIEHPELRARENKPSKATITIAVTQTNADSVEILVSDDGAGIDLPNVKRAAIERGLLSSEGASHLSDEAAVAFIFQPEVSTRPTVSEISGRGLGLAIVRDHVEKLGGRINVETQIHSGTTFRIVLPALLATFRGVLVQESDRMFVVPTVNVERVAQLKPAQIETTEGRETISLNDSTLALARLGAVLGLPAPPTSAVRSRDLSLLVLTSSVGRIALAVDQVLNEQEFLVKRLMKPLIRVRNVSGATVLASGRIAMILNAADLMKSARHTPAPPAAAQLPGAAKANASDLRKRILVAEDSITSRMLLKNILECAGYHVETAVDGIEALAELRTEAFDLVVSDVEMPHMNGFDLTAQIRADQNLANTPVVLVTALGSREDRERGIDAGANAYIVKSSFDQSQFLEAVRRLA